MKSILKYVWIALAALVMAACSPQEFDNNSMDAPDTVKPEQVTFTATPSAESANKINFTNTSQLKISYSVHWDLGNGTTGRGDAITGIYPMKGDYTVSMYVYAPDGAVVTKTYDLSLTNDDFSLVSSPVYVQLTGGIDSINGKTWVFDRYNNFTKEVADATGKDIRGHYGLSPAGDYSQQWWGAGQSEKIGSALEKIYDFKFTFKQAGMQLIIETGGQGFGRKACLSGSGQTNYGEEGDDAFFDYDGGAYTFSIVEAESEDTYSTLTPSEGAILGYYACNLVYEIMYQTGEVIALRALNTTENQDWVYIFCREDLNVEPPPASKELKAVPLSEDFEGEGELSINLAPENMGLSIAGYSNPAPVGINLSAKVFAYGKTGDFYSNLSFMASDYRFDLTTQNQIKLKVFIPSYNDYNTEYDVAGEWIASKKLLPQLAIKLQDSSKGGSAWETQTEIVKANLEKDKWLELEFDFSGVANRTDYDKIVIQFGAEGHAGPGFFFFDDFTFTE
jgi:hypothetical protein